MTIPPKNTLTMEELFNAATHGFGIIIATIICIFLLASTIRQGNFLKIIVFNIYGVALLLMYIISTLFHILAHTRAKKAFRFLDHATIFVLIAGTYTPIVATTVGGFWGWFLIATVWTAALCGIFSKIYYIDKLRVSLTFYLILSWAGFLFINSFIKSVPINGIIFLILGGIIYTFGIFFYVQKKIPFNHAIWHVFVLIGSFCHFSAILSLL